MVDELRTWAPLLQPIKRVYDSRMRQLEEEVAQLPGLTQRLNIIEFVCGNGATSQAGTRFGPSHAAR